MITGPEIRAARNGAGLTQEQLAVAVGVTLRTVGNWERGSTVPRDKEGALRVALGDHLDGAASNSPRLRAASDEELLSEVQRRFAAYKEGRSGHGDSPAQKTDGESVGPGLKIVTSPNATDSSERDESLPEAALETDDSLDEEPGGSDQ